MARRAFPCRKGEKQDPAAPLSRIAYSLVSDAPIIQQRLMEELRLARAEAAQQIASWEERLNLDHVVIGEDDFFSFADAGRLCGPRQRERAAEPSIPAPPAAGTADA